MKSEAIEKYEIIEVGRNEIKEAPYNPRTIDDEYRKRLKRGIKKFGLVEPLIWNKRTGNLVGGHQRLKILDEIHHNKKDYKIKVAAVDLDLQDEKKLNILLNNPLTQGDWDVEKLKDLIIDIKEIEDIGFEPDEIIALCPYPELSEILETPEKSSEDEKEIEPYKKEIDLMENAKQKHAEWKKKAAQLDDAEFYVVLVFENREQTDEFLRLCNYDMNSRYQDGRYVLNLIKKWKRK